ncbi:MAG: hypothetical protein CSA09_03325 [Candidatus Contendobacter odensis]|uniref:Uncharacterized protein n=1 Tax=Candidatus Contendibacter odensensis TaxID=1400860 RepID=A0A2G6PEW5_9GAMM|nr:MAG: hypothetical protein CSA09_03325 [Candidatus Contendobacter odensis]
MFQTVATVPAPQMLKLLDVINSANQQDTESQLNKYLLDCRQNGYEPPVALLDLARDNIRRKIAAQPGSTSSS